MKTNRLSEEEYFSLGLAVLGLTQKDYKENMATDAEGNTFTKEELIAIGKHYEIF